jgi:hypothetical protein
MMQFSILLNGTLSGLFSSSCGLRQGDPLSLAIVCSGYGGIELDYDWDNG